MRSRTAHRRRHARGFTFAELAVVILVAGILAAVALPRFADTGAFAAQGTFDRTLAAVRHAQKVAIAAHATVRVRFDANGVSACFDSGGACGAAVIDPGQGTALAVASTTDATISGSTFTYDSLGRPSTGPLTVTVAGAGVTKSFTIESETGHAHP